MAGQVKRLIDEIIAKRAGGNSTLITATKTKMILKGINPDNYSESSEDDSNVIEKLKALAKELGL